jgi:hypothetical protein
MHSILLLKALSSELSQGSRLGSKIYAAKLEASFFFILNFKVTPSNEEHITFSAV